MKRKVIFCAMAIMLVATLMLPVSADFDASNREAVAVVFTCMELDGGDYPFGWGTGFFVGTEGENPQYLITNHHVISSFLEYGAGELIDVYVDDVPMSGRSKIRIYYNSGDYDEAYLVDYDESRDIALLKLGSPTDDRKPLPLYVPNDDMVGATVYAIGYPGLSENIFAGAASSWGMSDASVTSGTISRFLITEGTGVEHIQIDCVIRHGNSGGPLVDENGAVIGVNTWSVSDSETAESINYAVNISEVLPMLNQYSVQFDLYQPEEESEDVPASAAAEEDTSGTSAAEPEESVEEVVEEELEAEPEEDSIPIMWIAIGGGGVLLVLLLIILLVHRSRKKTSKGASHTPLQNPPASSPMRQGFVRSLAEQHGGMRVPLSKQPALLGRNASDCQLVYRDSTPGVSGQHCSLTWDAVNGVFVLTDLRSTYGTFLQNGQQLKPGVAYPLREGAVFYLGDKNNLLRLEVE